MNPRQNCGNCRYSKGWSMTPSGRFRADSHAKCTYQVVLPVMPRCVQLYESRIAVWPDDGKLCPVFEQKPKEEDAK